MKKNETMRVSLITLTNYLRNQAPICVRVDGTPASQSLSKCLITSELGVTIEIGRTKKPNKNTVVD